MAPRPLDVLLRAPKRAAWLWAWLCAALLTAGLQGAPATVVATPAAPQAGAAEVAAFERDGRAKPREAAARMADWLAAGRHDADRTSRR